MDYIGKIEKNSLLFRFQYSSLASCNKLNTPQPVMRDSWSQIVDAVKKIGKELGLKILTKIDITPRISDPANKKELLATD